MCLTRGDHVDTDQAGSCLATWIIHGGQIYPCRQCNRRARLGYPKFERDISASSSTRRGSTAWRVGPLGASGTLYGAHQFLLRWQRHLLDFWSRPSEASAFLTSVCEIPNWRAIAEGLTPALKAARTAFSLPVVRDPPPASMGAWWGCVFASAANFSFDRCAESRPRRSASVVTAESSASISRSPSCLSAPARSFGKKWRGCAAALS
jgi:hypothetical protein